MFRSTCSDYRVLTTFCTRAAGALGIRHFPAPSLFKGTISQASGKRRRENADAFYWLPDVFAVAVLAV